LITDGEELTLTSTSSTGVSTWRWNRRRGSHDSTRQAERGRTGVRAWRTMLGIGVPGEKEGGFRSRLPRRHAGKGRRRIRIAITRGPALQLKPANNSESTRHNPP